MPSDNIVVRILSRIFDFMLLNALWVICSTPLVTIGASTTALYTVTLKMVTNEEGYIAKDFLNAFRQNFKQSTIIWAILLMVGFLLSLDFEVIGRMTGGIKIAAAILLGVVTLCCFLEVIFVFPLIAKFENTTLNMIKNAILIPVSRFPYAILVLIMTGLCLVLTFLNQTTILVGAVIWSLIGVAVLSYANSFLIHKVFEPYIKK